jgi:hypothetical protein
MSVGSVRRLSAGHDARLVAVANDVNRRRCRRDPLGEKPFAEQRVDEGSLAGIELADDDEQKQLIQLEQRPVEHLQVFRRRVQAGQRPAQLVNCPPLRLEQLLRLRGQESLQHIHFPSVRRPFRKTPTGLCSR